MNILVISPHGMYQDYTFSFVHNQAKEYVKMGHRVRVVLALAVAKRSNDGRRFGPPVEIIEKDGVEICFVRYLSLSSFGPEHFNHHSAVWACKLFSHSILKDFQPDVIHANTVDHGAFVGGYFKRKCKVPMVITAHGHNLDVELQAGNGAWVKKVCDEADVLVAVSQAYVKKCRETGISAPIQCILNGFSVQNVQEPQSLPFHIVQAGFLIERKRANLTIQAVAQLRKIYPEVSLSLVGDGPEQERFETLCEELHLKDAVHFSGRLTNQEVMEEMSRARFFVMPSVMEGFGIVYLEAMASGCITIGTEGEGIADIIVSGENGFLVPAEDETAVVEAIVQHIEWCLQNPEQSAAIAERGRRDALALTWEKNAGEYLRLFKSLNAEG